MYDFVEFHSLDTTLTGKLYLPSNTGEPLPIVIMAHGFSATIDGMVAEQYAEVFYNAGFAVLLYDHYSFGRSGGAPRQIINKWIQARGYIDAIDYVSTLSAIDSNRIAIWGDSMSGAEVIVVGAVDKRVKAIVAQVPACGSQFAPDDPDGSLFRSIQETLNHDDLLSLPTSSSDFMPIVSTDQIGAPSQLKPLTAYKWFIEYGAAYGTNWENRAARQNFEIDTPFHAGICAPHLEAALLMQIADNDEMPGANSDVAYSVFDSAPQPKERNDMDGGHFGLVYYPSALFTKASEGQREFLCKHL